MTRALVVLLALLPLASARAGDEVATFKKAFVEASRAGDATAQTEALRSLAAANTPDAAKLLAEQARSNKLPFEVRDAAQQALFGMSSAEVVLWAGQSVGGEERSAAARVLLCGYLSARAEEGDAQAGLLLLPALEDKEEPVRVAAVRGLSGVQRVAVVGALVRCLQGASGRLLGDCERALRRLTGKTQPKPEDWVGWWKANEEGFSFDAAEPEEGAQPERERFRTVTRLAPPGKKGKTIYEGVDSHRVVFVVDTSGSMQIRCQDSEGRSRSRLEYVMTELTTVIESELDEAAKFNVIVFSTGVQPWQKKLVKASPANRKKARKWLRKARPDGETNIYGALEMAFQHKDVDSIYFLTDGTPTVGEVKLNTEILGRVRQWNATRGVRIHAIGFLAGEGHQLIVEDKGMSKRFLTELAKENDGSFRAFE